MNEILEFLKEWRQWAADDAPHHPVFVAHTALCGNLALWAEAKHGCISEEFLLTEREFRLLRRERFGDEICTYPFGNATFEIERIEYSHHRNPDRLAWVDKLIEELSA